MFQFCSACECKILKTSVVQGIHFHGPIVRSLMAGLMFSIQCFHSSIYHSYQESCHFHPFPIISRQSPMGPSQLCDPLLNLRWPAALALLHWAGCAAAFAEGHAPTIDLDPVGLQFNSYKKQKEFLTTCCGPVDGTNFLGNLKTLWRNRNACFKYTVTIDRLFVHPGAMDSLATIISGKWLG